MCRCTERRRCISTNTLLAEGDSHSHLLVYGDNGISTNTLLAEGDIISKIGISEFKISTNTLLAEGDSSSYQDFPFATYFNQHPPRGG